MHLALHLISYSISSYVHFYTSHPRFYFNFAHFNLLVHLFLPVCTALLSLLCILISDFTCQWVWSPLVIK